ncbi:MAG TPA: putative quinol monooxygenase [Propionibacteriaceae bacterium]|nr:putative quinol monooxygenase [Propionibacteriaceae bacterium]
MTESPPTPAEAADHAGKALFLVVRIKPRRDKLAEAEAQLHRMRAAAQQEPGCVFMHLVQGVDDDPDTWVMLEQFSSRAAWDEHMASEHNQRGNAELEPLLREPSDLGLYYAK